MVCVEGKIYDVSDMLTVDNHVPATTSRERKLDDKKNVISVKKNGSGNITHSESDGENHKTIKYVN